MNGIELTNRLIDDLKKTIESRVQVSNPNFTKSIIDITVNDFVNFILPASNFSVFDMYIDELSQIINSNCQIINHNYGEKVDIICYYNDILKNSHLISDIFQQKIDNLNITEYSSHKPIAEILIENLDYIHESVN